MTPTSQHLPLSTEAPFSHLGWDELSKAAKQVESVIDGKLLELSQACRAGKVGTMIKDLGDEIETELTELANLIEAMEETLGDEPDHKSLNHHLLQRHREIYREYRREHRKLREQYEMNWQQSRMMAKVREDLGRNSTPNTTVIDPHEYLLSERTRIEHSHRVADTIIE